MTVAGSSYHVLVQTSTGAATWTSPQRIYTARIHRNVCSIHGLHYYCSPQSPAQQHPNLILLLSIPANNDGLAHAAQRINVGPLLPRRLACSTGQACRPIWLAGCAAVSSLPLPPFNFPGSLPFPWHQYITSLRNDRREPSHRIVCSPAASERSFRISSRPRLRLHAATLWCFI